MMSIGKSPEVVAAIAAQASLNPVGILGIWQLASYTGVFFLGILTLQCATYFRSFPRDNPWLKGLVIVTILLSIMQVGVVLATSWRWFVLNFGDWTEVIAFPWTVYTEVIFAQLTISFTQTFFAYRCFLLTQRNWVVLGFLIGGTFTSLGLFIAVGVALATDSYNKTLSNNLAISALCFTICTDLLITGLITWKLVMFRKGVNPSTDSGLSKLLRFTWEAAAPPAASAIANLIVIVTLSNKNLLYGFFNTLTPRLYVFSLMFTLNSRPEVRGVFNLPSSSLTVQPSPSRTISSRWSSRIKSPRLPKKTRVVFANMDSAAESATVCAMDVPDERMGGDGGYSHDLLANAAADTHVPIDLDQWGEADERSDTFTMRTLEEVQRPERVVRSTGADMA